MSDFRITQEQGAKLLNFLLGCPAGQVLDLIGILQTLPPIADPPIEEAITDNNPKDKKVR